LKFNMNDSSRIEPRLEYISISSRSSSADLATGLQLREFISGVCGARGISSGTATFQPGAELPYHLHRFSEAVVILEGEAELYVEGRCYRLAPLDAIHFPAGVAHQLANPSTDSRLVAYWAFATDVPSRELVEDIFKRKDCRSTDPQPGVPEHITRFAEAPKYQLAELEIFTDLFGRRTGSMGICGGYGRFEPGASLPCHIHDYDESITIVTGEAVCQVMGRRYQLSNCDTALVPTGRPHRFLNESSEPMAMIWLYAGDEPGRAIVDSAYCSGVLQWPENTKDKQ
jgi:quercetin dioxygenase-like cupin family protein